MSDKRRNAAYFVEKLFADMDGHQAYVGAADLRILGGEFEASRLVEFMEIWDKTPAGSFQWAMVEEVSQFYVSSPTNVVAALPGDSNLLERLRLFGPHGDLDLRRDGARFLWSFIGETDVNWPDFGTFAPEDFWQTQEPKPVFRVVNREFQTWKPDDKRANDGWRGSTSLAGKDVKVKQIHYLDNGRIAFVRYVTLFGGG